MPRREFRALFCEQFHCPPEDFDRRLFAKCLYAHARLLAPLARKWDSEFFAKDLEMIHYLGEARSSSEANAELADFMESNRQHRSFWRTGLRIRVSGKKTAHLVERLYAHSHSERKAKPRPELPPP